MADSVSGGRLGLWSELGPLPGLSVSDCTLLAPLGQDMLMGADAHVEQMGSVPSVSCAQGEESPELGGNIHILTLPGPTTDSFLSRVTSLPSLGLCFLVQSTAMVSGSEGPPSPDPVALCWRQLLTAPPHPLGWRVGLTGCTLGTWRRPCGW